MKKATMRIVRRCINHQGVATYALKIHTTGEWQYVYYCASCHARKPEHVQAAMVYIGEKPSKKSA